jgi:ribonuclease J
MFPDENTPGIDLIIPDISYLLERRDRIKAILITHGHEDHTGALPYILPELRVPLYAPRLAHGLITVKLREHHALRSARLNVLEPGRPVKLGRFRVESFRVCHSIPDAMGLAIRTPLGLIVHSGDFKIDHTPVDGNTTDLARLAQYGAEGVFLLLSDSTYAELPGYTPSEQLVGETLDRVIAQAPGRVIIATFASLISRIHQVIEAAARHGRKVAIVGRSMVDNVEMALEMGYLAPPQGVLIGLKEAKGLPGRRVVLITTGSQGEPTSALVRIANRDHKDISIEPGDTVVISATPIPGNETVVSKTIDNLCRQGARVLYDRIAFVHVHGHGSQEELKMVLNLTRPRFFVPVHGEYRHLVAHAHLAESVGIPPSNIFVLEDGDLLELTPSGGKVTRRVPAGHIYVNGLRTRDIRSLVLRDRRLLSRDGIVVVIMALERATGRPIRPPEVVSSGFAEREEAGQLFRQASNLTLKTLEESEGHPVDRGAISAKVRETVSKFLYKETGRRPIILPVVLEV